MKQIQVFWVLALATLLERWAWSGYRAVIVLHLALFWTTDQANQTNYWVASFIYFIPLILSLAITSFKREQYAVQTGMVLAGLGYLALFFTSTATGLLAGLVALILGRSLVINTLPALIAKLRSSAKTDDSLDVWMTRLYMFANAGSFIGPIVAGILHDWYTGYQEVFFASALIAIVCWGLVNYCCRNWEWLPPESREAPSSRTMERWGHRAGAILIITMFSVVFWSGFEQKSGPLNIFASNFVDLQVGPWAWKPEWFQSINPLLVVAFAPAFDWLWRTWDRRLKDRPISPFVKLAGGLIFLGLGFWMLPIFRYTSNSDQVSWIALVFVYVFHTIGELLLEPIGQSLMLKLSPPNLQALFLSLWNVSTSAASILAGFYPLWFGANLSNQYTPLWTGLGIGAVSGGLVLFLVSGALTNWCRPWLFPQPELKDS